MSFRSGQDSPPRVGAVPQRGEVHIFWLAGMSCDGCTVSMTGASNPSLEDLIAGTIPLMPKVRLHHPMLDEESGDDFMEPFKRAIAGRLGAPYLLVLEGSVPDDQALPRQGGCYAALGAGGSAVGGERGRPDRMTDWLKALAPGAVACIAIGTCATWGGIPAAAGNITGSMGLMDFLGPAYRSASGVPVINVPGCAPTGDNFTEVVAAVLNWMHDVQPLPEFDELGRPAWQFGETVHRHCPKAGYYEEGVFSHQPGDNQCLVEIGCWGPVVQCNIVERGAINHIGGCMVAGGPCIGCTMPGFPDKYSPFYKSPPGSALSGGLSKVYGGGIRRLRRMSMKSGNTEPAWDNAHEVPSAWARAYGGKTPVDRAMGYFYKNLQYHGTVHQGKRNSKQPLPRTRDILRKDGIDLEQSVPVLGESVTSREEL
ncbi:MAG: NADH-quinone oxidoreductase subunit B family protein [Solirubrobacteraceae bacterium]